MRETLHTFWSYLIRCINMKWIHPMAGIARTHWPLGDVAVIARTHWPLGDVAVIARTHWPLGDVAVIARTHWKWNFAQNQFCSMWGIPPDQTAVVDVLHGEWALQVSYIATSTGIVNTLETMLAKAEDVTVLLSLLGYPSTIMPHSHAVSNNITMPTSKSFALNTTAGSSESGTLWPLMAIALAAASRSLPESWPGGHLTGVQVPRRYSLSTSGASSRLLI